MAGRKSILEGTPANIGTAKGPVRVVLNPTEQPKSKKGYILVTVMTNPIYVPLMRNAKGIITDVGGLLCHAAILSRELGLPCVVGTGKATKILRNGTMVEIDGRTGKIYLIKE